MKKNLVIVSMILGSAFAGFSQKKNVTSAIMCAKKNQFIKAKPYIDKAIKNEDTRTQAKTWSWKAAIYAGIAGMKTEEAMKIKESMDVSAEIVHALQKTKEYDKKGYYQNDLRNIAGPMYNASFNGGIEAYNNQNYKKAFDNFTASQVYGDIIGLVDTIGAYNAGMSAVLIENYEAAELNYKKCIKHGYGGADVYLKLSDVYKKMGATEKANTTILEAKSKFKGDPAVILNEAQIFADNKEYDKAKASLEDALKNNPSNFQLQYAAAIIYSNMELFDAAIVAYKKALALKPEMEELKSDMAIVHYNKIVIMNEEMNKIDYTETAKYDKAKAERDAYITEVLPMIEARYKDDSSESMKRILNNLYGLTGQTDKRIK